METPWKKSYGRHLHGRGQLMTWKTTTAVLLLALGIVVKTTSGGVHPLPSPRVVGGKNAELGSSPWQVCVLYNNYPVCGGSLISSTWVVTAAHCLKNRNHSNFQAVLGVLNLTGENPTKQLIVVESVLQHEIYQGDGTRGDLALMKLQKSAIFNENVRPIKLPPQNQEYPEGTLCWLTGWGNIAENVKLASPQTLQWVQIPLVSNSECNKMFHTSIKADPSHVFVTVEMICAGKSEGGVDACQGDSGGPLVFRSTDGISYLIGLVSWGYGCAQPMKLGVYTRVSNFTNWILEKIVEPKVGEQRIEKTAINVSILTTHKPNVAVNVSTLTTHKPNVAVNVSTLTTHKPDVTSQVFTSTKETDQDTTSAGRRLQIPISLSVMGMVLTSILVVV